LTEIYSRPSTGRRDEKLSNNIISAAKINFTAFKDYLRSGYFHYFMKLDDKYIFEIGDRNSNFKQIKEIEILLEIST